MDRDEGNLDEICSKSHLGLCTLNFGEFQVFGGLLPDLHRLDVFTYVLINNLANMLLEHEIVHFVYSTKEVMTLPQIVWHPFRLLLISKPYHYIPTNQDVVCALARPWGFSVSWTLMQWSFPTIFISIIRNSHLVCSEVGCLLNSFIILMVVMIFVSPCTDLAQIWGLIVAKNVYNGDQKASSCKEACTMSIMSSYLVNNCTRCDATSTIS